MRGRGWPELRAGRTGQGELHSGALGAGGQTEGQSKQEGGWRGRQA